VGDHVRVRPVLVLTTGASLALALTLGAAAAGADQTTLTDRRRFRTCASPFRKTLGVGTRLIRIRAVSPAGIEDPQPSRVRVTIRR
jgi:hypothetical protein